MGLMGKMSLLVLFFVSTFAIASDPAPEVEEVALPITKVYIPEGFDTNDSIQVAVSGVLKNSCSQIGVFTSFLNRHQKRVEIRLTAYDDPESDKDEKRCIEKNVPFFQVLRIGRLWEAQDYNLVDGNSQGRILGVIHVAEARTPAVGTDDETYAPLLDAYLTKDPRGKNQLVLKGVFSSSCMKLESPEFKATKDVLVIYPRVSKVADRRCNAGTFPFENKFYVAPSLPRGPFFLHVRSMGGQAINKLVY